MLLTRFPATTADLWKVAATSLARVTQMGAVAAICWLLPFARALAEETNVPAQPVTSAVAPAAPSPEEIKKWVSELGHNEYAVRQAAASQLLAAGMTARQPLLEIVNSTNPETRSAARRLVSLIDRTEFHRRLQAFAADTDGKLGLSMPGWDQYQKMIGSDPASRALFVDMQRQEGAVIAAVFGGSKHPPEDLWESRLSRIERWQLTAGDRISAPPLGSCAAILFLAAAAEMNVSDTAAGEIESLIQKPPLRESLQTDNQQQAVRKLVVNWLLHCPNKNEQILKHRLDVISASGLEEGVQLALAIVGHEPPYAHVQPFIRAAAVLVVGQFGKHEYVDRLEPLLEDTGICMNMQGQVPGQPVVSVQVRDVALVVILHLTDQKPADYGYLNARLDFPHTYQMQNLARENDKQRDDAIAKWRAWRVAHKGEDPKEEPSKN